MRNGGIVSERVALQRIYDMATCYASEPGACAGCDALREIAALAREAIEASLPIGEQVAVTPRLLASPPVTEGTVTP